MPTTEERLAALEKQMAAWIDQQPTTYYTHQYSGEEIDAAVGRALTGGALDTSVTNISNQLGTFARPNLLDNWYFGRPVNQRGQAEYSGSAGYWIDRWKRDAGIVCAVDGGMVTCTRLSAGNNAISQLLDGYAGLAGQTVTLSVLCAGTPGTSVTVGHNDGGSSVYETYTPCTGALQLIRSTFTVAAAPTQFASIARAQFSENFAEESVKFLAAKLELGPTQTLARKEGDKWALNEVPDYGEQLRRCQEYAIDGKYYTTVGQLNYDGNMYYISVQFPCVMRTLPAITLKEISAIGWGNVPISNAEVSWVDTNGFFASIKDLSNMNNFIGKSCIVTYFATADL